MQRPPVPARSLADEGGERVDEGARVGPAAGGGGVDDRGAVGEHEQGAVDAQLGPPLAKAHSGLLGEEARQGPFARADPPAQLGERGGTGHVVLDDVGESEQTLIAGLGQVERLFGSGDRVVDDDHAQPVPRGHRPPGDARVLGCGEREQGLPGQRRDREDGRAGRQEFGEGCGHEDDSHVGDPVGSVLVGEVRGDPHRPVRRRDPGAGIGDHRQHAAGRIDEVPLVMNVGRGELGVAETLDQLG